MNAFRRITGAAALAGLLPLIVKYPVRRLGMKEAGVHLMKLHEPASGLFYLAAAVHGISSAACGRRGKAVCGAAAFAVGTALIADCHVAKDERKMDRHRAYSLALALLCTAHLTIGNEKQ